MDLFDFTLYGFIRRHFIIIFSILCIYNNYIYILITIIIYYSNYLCIYNNNFCVLFLYYMITFSVSKFLHILQIHIKFVRCGVFFRNRK